MKNRIKPIALYLPQYHPIPENDEWWGTGFTEWWNVAKAQPQFKGHYQPHIPTEFGFYDLRLNEVLVNQAERARDAGIHGFCFYHYWFNGKRLLEEPLDRMVQNGKPDFPYMVCWANENWTRRWDGKDQDILIEQEYTEGDYRKHIQFLCSHYFSDERYITVDDRPFIMVYRPSAIPDFQRMVEIWREEALKAGFKGLYVGYFQVFNYKVNPQEIGVDVAVEFQPDFGNLPKQMQVDWGQSWLSRIRGISSGNPKGHRVYDYRAYAEKQMARPFPEYPYYPCITPSWDNTPRRKEGAFILHNSAPEVYGDWLKHAKDFLKQKVNLPERFLFINAWNEWAEGNHLEPCDLWGGAYLEATRKVIEESS